MAHPRRKSLFQPCIDLHNGEVKQIVGGTLHEDDASRLQTNFVARRASFCIVVSLTNAPVCHSHPSSYYAALYREHALEGGHVIKLGPGNDRAAKEALAAWPGASRDWFFKGCSADLNCRAPPNRRRYKC